MSPGRFNPPPHWPVPPGWQPRAGWMPDPSWPPAPPGWQFWVDAPAPPRPTGRSRRAMPWALAAIVVIAALIVGVGVLTYSSRDDGPEVIVLRPVDARGDVQSDWRTNADDLDATPIDCSFGSASAYDVGDSVRSCGATADSGDACWPAADDNHVLCVRDPFTRVVDLLPADGLSTPRKSAEHGYRPFAVTLDDGTRCRARVGGAWGSSVVEPDWVAFYGCGGSAADFTVVWGPADRTGTADGITRDGDDWSVMVGTETGPLTKHRVAKVYYVGVAGEHDAFGDS